MNSLSILFLTLLLFANCRKEDLPTPNLGSAKNNVKSETDYEPSPHGEDHDEYTYQGLLKNPQEGAIVSGTVTLSNADTTISATTDIFGQYTLTLKASGPYTFEASAGGYQPLVKTVNIVEDSTLSIDTIYPI